MDLDRGSSVELVVDSEDEFGEDYEDPGSLTPEQVSGTVIYTLDWSVSTVVDQIDADPDDPESRGVLVTAPPFQRRTAWTDERQSLFIESLMLGLPVPPLVLAESLRNEGQFYVLDGKQRLTALKRFFDRDDPLKLRGLELLNDRLKNRTLADITASPDLRKYIRSLQTQPIRTIVVRNWRTPALLHLIFSRLNKASVPLASHELRQALYPGDLTNFVNRVSAVSPGLRKARRLREADFRLRDAETLLRYLSFKSNLPKYRGDLRDFLDRNLKGGNDSFDEIEVELNEAVAQLEAAISVTFDIFGKASFLRFDGERGKYMPRFNVAVFDALTWYFADPDVASAARENEEEVGSAFERLCTNDSTFAAFLTSTTKTGPAAIGRLERWGGALGQVIGKELHYANYVKPIIPLAGRAR